MKPLPRSRYIIYGLIVALGLVADQLSKWWVFETIGPPGRTYAVTGFFSLTTGHNPGALWGFGSGFLHANSVFAAISALAVAVILYWLFGCAAAHDRILTVALSFVSAGALGNFCDRVFVGSVRDFLDFHVIRHGAYYGWPVFNLADMLLVTGTIFLVADVIWSEHFHVPALELPAEAQSRLGSQPTRAGS